MHPYCYCRGIQNETREHKFYFFILLFGSSALPEVAVIGSVVPIDHGIALTQLVVIAGFPVDLIGRLVAFPDPGEWRKEAMNEGQEDDGAVRKKKKKKGLGDAG